MKDFVERLETEFVRAIRADVARATTKPPGVRHRSRAVVAATATLGLGGACAAALVVFGGAGPATAVAMPVLDRAPGGGAEAHRLVVSTQAAGLDFDETRTFATPRGPGYVVPAPDRGELCLVISDSGAPGSAGVTCKKLEDAENEGIVGSLVAVEGSPENSELVVILPKGAHDVTLTASDGEPQDPSVDRGVLVVDAKQDLTATWRNESGEAGRATVRAHEPAGRTFYACGDGRKVPMPKGKFSPRQACRNAK